MSETPFFFPGDGFELFGMFHAPQGTSRGTAFCFCAPFAEEKLWSHLVYVNFARELARRGYPVLRFDYRGTGDSDGDFEDGSVDAYLADIRTALAVLAQRSGCASMALLGLRFGGTLAALAAEGEEEVRGLVLWSPVVDGAAYMQELLRMNLAVQLAMHREVREGRDVLVRKLSEGGIVNVEGYAVTGRFFDAGSTIRLHERSRYPGARCLIAHVAAGAHVPVDVHLDALGKRYPRARVVTSAEAPFWKEIKPFYARAGNLFRDTLAWLDDDAL